jgi:hypothetical protein
MDDKSVSALVNLMLIVTGFAVLILSYAFGLLDPLFK